MEHEQLETIIDSLRKFCEKEVIPKRDEMDENPKLCKSIMKKLGKLGFLAPMVPEEYGGMGMSHGDVSSILGEVMRSNPSLGLSVAAHSLLCVNTILTYGSDEQKSRYLPKLTSGEWLGAWGVTEPGAGSDVNGIQAAGRKVKSKYVLKGNKTFITNSYIADVLVVYVKTANSSKSDITGFILERDFAGLTLGKPMAKFGMEGSPTGDIFMENVEVDESQMIGETGSGFKQITNGFNHERLYAAPASAAIMRHCIDTAMKYASQREAFGKPILEYQAIQLKIAKIYAQVQMVEATARELFRLPMNDPEFHMKVSGLKIFATQWAVQACLETMQILGGLGYTRESDIGRFMRDAKLFEIGGGTTDIQHLIIFKGLMKKYSSSGSL